MRKAFSLVSTSLGDKFMKKLLLASLICISLPLDIFADWDPVFEAQEAAQRAAAQKAQDEQKQKAEKMKQDALAQARSQQIADYRKQLGSDAAGKSDAEVERLYQAKIQRSSQEAAATIAEAQRAMMKTPKNVPQKVDMNELSANTKAATGKSFSDLSKMSDAELEALSKEMEEKYGD